MGLLKLLFGSFSSGEQMYKVRIKETIQCNFLKVIKGWINANYPEVKPVKIK